MVTRQRQLLDERAKLLEAHYAGAIPLDLLKTEQDRIASELNTIETRISATDIKYSTVEANLKKAYDLISNLHLAYTQAPPRTRRLMNQAIFKHFLINDTETVTGTLADPFALLLEASRPRREKPQATLEKPRGPAKTGPRGLSIESLVELVWSEICQSGTAWRPAICGPLFSAGRAHRPLSTSVSRLICAGWDRMTGCAR